MLTSAKILNVCQIVEKTSTILDGVADESASPARGSILHVKVE